MARGGKYGKDEDEMEAKKKMRERKEKSDVKKSQRSGEEGKERRKESKRVSNSVLIQFIHRGSAHQTNCVKVALYSKFRV